MATTQESKRQPVSDAVLQKIAQDTCDSVLSTANGYVHNTTEGWNSAIIAKILESVISAAGSSSTSAESQPLPQYKYAVNSTIIQHIAPSSSADAATGAPDSTDSESWAHVSESSTQTADAGVGTTSASGQTVSPPSTPKEGQSAGESGGSGARVGAGAGAGASSTQPQKDRRGMHSATGAYWNNDTDGMWSFKWEGGEAKGMDVVVSVIWIAV